MFENFSDKTHSAFEKLLTKLDGWFDGLILKLPNFIVAIITIAIFYFLAGAITKIVDKTLMRKVSQKSVRVMVGKLVFGIVIIIGFFIALGILDLDKVLTSVLAGAGIVSLAVGLALQGTLSNTLSGITLSFLPKIRVGDFVETNGFTGIIREINLRFVEIIQRDNNVVMIPNSQIIENPLKNYSITNRSKIFVDCGIGYESDLQMVENLVISEISKKFKQEDNEEVHFYYQEFGDSSINFTVVFWSEVKNNRDILKSKHDAIKTIKAAFNEHNVNIPFPIRTVYFNDTTPKPSSPDVSNENKA